MYANTRFKKNVNEWGQVTEWINPGDEVSQGDLNLSDEQWQDFIDSGAVVEEYPDNLDPQVPPVEYYRQNPRDPSFDEYTPTEEGTTANVDTAGERGEKLPGAPGTDGGPEEKKPGWLGNK